MNKTKIKGKSFFPKLFKILFSINALYIKIVRKNFFEIKNFKVKKLFVINTNESLLVLIIYS